VSGEVVKVVAHRPIHRDAIELYVLRYRKAVVGYVYDRAVTEYTNEFLTLDDGVPTWHAYPPGGEVRPFITISGLLELRLGKDDFFMKELVSWATANTETLKAYA
jgi:hypothetical protein